MDLVGEMVLRFPKQEISEASQAAYALDLSDLPYDELRVVCLHLWRTEEWFPSIATIRKAWCEMTLADTVMTEGQAIEWAMRQVGAIGGPGKFPDPVVEEMMRRITWARLERTEDDDWTRKELAKAYREARDQLSRKVMAGEVKPPPLALSAPAANRRALKAVS